MVNIGSELVWVVVAGLIVWLLVVSVFLVKTIKHYRRLAKGVKEGDLKKILEDILKDLGTGQESDAELKKSLVNLEKETNHYFQKMGLLRYNPFSDAGGDQSFVLALLDKTDSGLVISSLHGRDNTRIYTKPVKKGKGEVYELSKEEEEAIRKAKKAK